MRLVIDKTVWYGLEAGDVFTIEPGEVAEPHFLTNVELVVVKIPSIPKDKVVVK